MQLTGVRTPGLTNRRKLAPMVGARLKPVPLIILDKRRGPCPARVDQRLWNDLARAWRQ